MLMGALMAGLLYLLARVLFARRSVAVLTATLVVAEGMLFANARIGMNDVYVTTFLVAAALVSAWLITVANIPNEIANLARPFIDNPKLLMVVLMLLVLVVGTALDFAPTVLILTPVLMPLVKQAGIDPVYFGVLFIMNNAIGLLTPPVGTVLNVVCGVGRVAMHDVIKGVMPFLLSQVVVLGLLIAFPELVMTPLRWLMMK
jgi:tripartite ATP-independent transporter DctM subunit